MGHCSKRTEKTSSTFGILQSTVHIKRQGFLIFPPFGVLLPIKIRLEAPDFLLSPSPLQPSTSFRSSPSSPLLSYLHHRFVQLLPQEPLNFSVSVASCFLSSPSNQPDSTSPFFRRRPPLLSSGLRLRIAYICMQCVL